MEALMVDHPPALNRKALIRIYEQYSAPLFRYAYRLLGDKDLAEDCVSETFSRFLHAVRDGRGPTENIRAYLYRIAHNWANDHYRRPNAAVPLDMELNADPEGNPLHQVTVEQERARVRTALMRLPTDQRQVIELRFLEDWPHEQVALALGRSTEATRALQHRALAGLRRILEESNPGTAGASDAAQRHEQEEY